MTSKYGGEPVKKSQYGGIPIEEPSPVAPVLPVAGAADPVRHTYADIRGRLDRGEWPENLPDPIGASQAFGNLGLNAAGQSLSGLVGLLALDPSLSDDPSQTADRARQVTADALYVEPTERALPTLQAIQDAMQPVSEWWDAYGDKLAEDAYQSTGSPGAAAMAKTVPDLMAQGLVLGGAPKAAAKTAAAQTLRSEAKQAGRMVREATPSGKDLRQSADSIFNEIDALGVRVDSQSVGNLIDGITLDLTKKGMHRDVTPAAAGIIRHLEENLRGGNIHLPDLEIARQVAKGAAASLNKKEAALGMSAIRRIDDFIETLQPQQLVGQGNPAKISAMYRRAREQWGRMRRSELVDQAIAAAATKRSGFENGLRNEFAKLVEKARTGKLKGFKPHEIAIMERVADGTATSNAFREIGKMGLASGKLGNNWLGAFLTGGALGTLVDPVVGASAVLTGTAAKALALKFTKGNSQLASDVIRAGADADKIARAYLRNTPVKQRNPQELALLLIHRDITLPPAEAVMSQMTVYRKALELAAEQRALVYGAAANIGSQSTLQ